MTRTFLLLLAAVATAYEVRYDGYRLMDVGPIKEQAEIDVVNKIISEHAEARDVLMLNDFAASGAPVSLLVGPNVLRKVKVTLDDQNIAYVVSDADFQATIDANKVLNDKARAKFDQNMNGDVPVQYDHDAYLRYDQQVAWMQSKAASSPIANMFSIGASIEGRTIWGISINDANKALPAVWIDSNIHAREWISSASVLYVIDEILIGTSADAVHMRNTYRFYILPCGNPDGYEFSHTNDRMWRKNRRNNAGSACMGVDLNRNWDVNWSGEGASTRPCDDTYCGTSAFSEPETQRQRDFLTTLRGQCNVAISIHSYSQYWLVPWGSYTYKPVDYPELMRVGNLAANAIQNTNGLRFTVGTPPDILYVASGGTLDWVKAALNMEYSYSPELRPATAAQGGFELPPSNIVPSGQETFAGIVATCRNAQHYL